jgi:GT2 family glycosyltransferase
MPLLSPESILPERDASTRVALSVVVLNWNAAHYLRAALSSLVGQNWKHNIEVIVVDNASKLDDSVDIVRGEYSQVRLLALEKNIGFAAGNNAALPYARGDYLLFLNPDTVTHEGALDILIDWMDAHPQAGACGPKLLNDDGTLQKSCRAFPSFGAGLFRSSFLGRMFPNNPWTRSYLMLDFSHDRAAQVDWLSGAALLVRRTTIEKIGKWDEDFFMYCEDVDLCYRLKEGNWQRWYVPDAVISHRIGGSSDWLRGVTIRRHHSAMLRYYIKHHGHGARGLLIPIAAAGIGVRALSALGKLYWFYWRHGVPNKK